MRDRDTHATYLSYARPLALRFLLLLAIWLVIAEGEIGSLVVGAPLALVAALLSVSLAPVSRSRVSLPGLARFVVYFAVESVRGGIDVALRAYRPSMPIDPAYVDYVLRLAEPLDRVVFANTISLLPGTLSASLEGDRLVVHALDRAQPVVESLETLEHRVADLFGRDVGAGQEREM